MKFETWNTVSLITQGIEFWTNKSTHKDLIIQFTFICRSLLHLGFIPWAEVEKKSKVMTTILFIKQSSMINYCQLTNCKSAFNWIFAHLASILVKDIIQYILSCYCSRRIPIFRAFFTPTTRKFVCPPLTTSHHRHVDELTSRPGTQSSWVYWSA